jgi:hypothetical protein
VDRSDAHDCSPSEWGVVVLRPVHALCAEVEHQLGAQFETVRTFHLSDYNIGHRMGEFDCFMKIPGRCRINDEGQEIEHAHAIWHHLQPWLEAGATQVDVVVATGFVRGESIAHVAARRCEQADLLMIISPLYWDSLPYPGLLALEHIHAHRHEGRNTTGPTTSSTRPRRSKTRRTP